MHYFVDVLGRRGIGDAPTDADPHSSRGSKEDSPVATFIGYVFKIRTTAQSHYRLAAGRCVKRGRERFSRNRFRPRFTLYGPQMQAKSYVPFSLPDPFSYLPIPPNRQAVKSRARLNLALEKADDPTRHRL